MKNPFLEDYSYLFFWKILLEFKNIILELKSPNKLNNINEHFLESQRIFESQIFGTPMMLIRSKVYIQADLTCKTLYDRFNYQVIHIKFE
jgi:hypothetical protein